MSCSTCCLRPLRIRSSRRPRTSLYSSRMGRDTYKRAGLVMAISRSALQPRWLNSRGNQDICIDYETERKHYRFGFWDREVAMIWSIWREVNVLVPFRSDSSPMILKTSGSGAASLT